MLSKIVQYYFEAMRNHRLSSKELARLQDRKTRALIQYAFDAIPFYHDRIRAIGKLPSDFETVSDLKYLPILTRKEIFDNVQKGITNPDAKVGYVRRTSGTTGTPLTIPWAARYCDTMMALRIRRLKDTGVGFFDKAAYVAYFGTSSGIKSENDKEKSGRLERLYKVFFGYPDVRIPLLRQRTMGLGPNNLNEICHSLLKMRPDLLSTRPSYARRLANTFRNEGLELHVKQLDCGSEFLSNGCRKDLESFYQAQLFEGYGCQELGTLGSECREHSGIHLYSDYFAFETLHDGKAVSSEGELGGIVVTGFHNEAMPLIRYQLGDLVVHGDNERCNCGSSLPRLASIQGRPNDGLVSQDGIKIPPGKIASYIETVLDLRDYQVIQKSSSKLLVRLKEKDLVKKETLEGLTLYSRNLLCNEYLDVEFESWSEKDIPPKYRPIVCEVN